MIEENKFGFRDKRGHFVPKEAADKNPLWVLPVNLKKIFNWFIFSYIFSWNLFYLFFAFIAYYFFTPPMSEMKTFSVGWASEILLRNYVMGTIFFSLIHIPLYISKSQGIKFKFNPNWPEKIQKLFTFNKQIFDNLFWSLFWGVPIWTAYEVISLWLYASGRIPFIEFSESPVYFFLILLLIPAFRDAHFYLVHRVLHFKFMYKIAHSVHHRNINPGPWSSLSMHPIEHLLYFSGVIVHWVILSHPLHAIYHLFHASLGSANGHIGFKQMLLNDKQAIDLSNYNHYLHHKYFEVNYGNLMIPFDQWFGTYHDGSEEMHNQMRLRLRGIKRK